MTPEGIRERFENYRKWFRTLLVKEFMNLPLTYQERFLVLLQKFIEDCRKVHEEAKSVQEKTIRIIVQEVIGPDNFAENYVVVGKIEGTESIVRVLYPVSKPMPKQGKKVSSIVYSIKGDVWYSSKEELIQGAST